MDPVARVFNSHEDADKATREYYRSLTPAQRLDILLELIARVHEADPDAQQGIAPVYRIVELSQG